MGGGGYDLIRLIILGKKKRELEMILDFGPRGERGGGGV